MSPRLFAICMFAGKIMLLSATGSLAQGYEFDVDERYTGGAPRSEVYRRYNMSPVRRTTVYFQTNEKPGTIIINTRERRLYYILGDGRAIRYGIGVGRDGFTWRGEKTVTAMREWPGWTPPPQMRQRQPYLPHYMPGGIENPLGARAMYLGSTLYRIHGSNEPETIGQAVSSGCFRMTNDDVIDLYNRVQVGTRVVVL